MTNFFDTNIEFLKGVGPKKASLLNTELRIFTYGDLIQHYPFRHEDRSNIMLINAVTEEHSGGVLLQGKLTSWGMMGEGRSQRLVATLSDGTGQMELVWFQGAKWVERKLKKDVTYLVYGKPTAFRDQYNIAHAELEEVTGQPTFKGLLPIYNTTEKLKKNFLDSKAIARLQWTLISLAYPHISETLPTQTLETYRFISKRDALSKLHFPADELELQKAKARLKFEELFFIQLKLLSQKAQHKKQFKGLIFKEIPSLNLFYKNHLPFDLTGAQKRVVREIYHDMCSGKQMNRLLQGDVGSGKTMVAFLCMLMAVDNDAQACLVAPTEILAEQHYRGLKEYCDLLQIPIAKLTGSSKKSERAIIHKTLLDGSLKILVGTHAILEEIVAFKLLGLCVVDEQHRFGVEQRARLWQKNKHIPPHILVMTATPIPRTLAMTLYGDLDISVLDEMPVGRKPIQTIHSYDKDRLKVFGFIKKQIQLGGQIYIVYPLIEESEKSDLKDLHDGYESISRAFPEYAISIVHGRMKAKDKEYEMMRFVKNETSIMVATTVIEVGVNVSNASVMVIENAERFGLSQLHQLRGRVGRGADQSYCILMTTHKLSKDSKVRIKTMVETNNGFIIADVDLKLRGPGDLTGTQQSGVLDLLLADLSQDAEILKHARRQAMQILEEDPDLSKPDHSNILRHIQSLKKQTHNWSRIS
jgi:ATP-dependent DNA helicase RecG